MTTILQEHTVGKGSELFEKLFEKGSKQLTEIRQEILDEQEMEIFKEPRTYIASEAAELIGRSKSWLREYEANSDIKAERDARGHARYTLDHINHIRKDVGTMPKRPDGSSVFVMPIFNYKGGVGKTTTAAHFAQFCALMGWRVLVVDFDPQGTATYSLSGKLPDVDLTEKDVPVDALLNDPSKFGNTIMETYFPNVFLSPSNLYMSELELTLGNDEINNRDKVGPSPTRLLQCLELFNEHFDIVIIDCPPNQGVLVNNALIAATGITVPLPPQAYDRASFVSLCANLSSLYSMLEDVQLSGPSYFNILITRHGKTQNELDQEAKIRELYDGFVLKSNIYTSAEIGGAAEKMSTIYDLERPLRTKDTYMRAMDILNAANNEMLTIIKNHWGMTA